MKALQDLNKSRKNMWVVVVAFFLIGDSVTTSFGMFQPSLYEVNPVFEEYFNSGNVIGVFFIKALITIFAYWIDKLIYGIFGTWGFPIIPIYLAHEGIVVTLANMQILGEVGVNPIIVSIVIFTLSVGFIEYLRNEKDYNLT